ncbi:hypothetical protein JXO52_07605 [bacterium]|nr:hypothetical protein [bacterium]
MAKILEIEFKGGRKSIFANPQEFPFTLGDQVIVQAEKGEDMGVVINMGSLVDKRAGNQELPQVIRKPGKKDLARKDENTRLEEEAFEDCLKRIEEHGLDMKLVDVEYQFDRNKTTFYFTSENRVDFRALVRDLARKYHTRIELRQIGVRDEAKRIGGVGVCGRSLCCSTFLREFEPVVTQLAKDQNLALNPTKLSGCCGRLMCCLRYEEDFYNTMTKKFPPLETKIRTDRGTARLVKTDIFSETGTVVYESGEQERFTLERLNEFLSRKQDKKRQEKKKRHEQKRQHTKSRHGKPDSGNVPQQKSSDNAPNRQGEEKQEQKQGTSDKRRRGRRRYKKNRSRQKPGKPQTTNEGQTKQ